MSDLPDKPKRGLPAHLEGKGFKPGQSGNPLGRSIERKIDGVPISKVFNDNLGPAAIKVIEKVLHAALAKDPSKINRTDVDLARFMHDKVYGKAIERMEIESNVVHQPAYVTSTLTIEQMEAIVGSVVEADYQEIEDDE